MHSTFNTPQYSHIYTAVFCIYSLCEQAMYQPSTKTPKKVFQKGGFCNAKRGFLHAKNHTFATQKPYFYTANM